jgi:hypothetical protein
LGLTPDATHDPAPVIPEAAGSGKRAALDESFFRMTADVFSHAFCAGASALLADNDPGSDTDDPTDHVAARHAAMRRHPSSRGRA